jgi:dihydroxy-acid dehydratase
MEGVPLAALKNGDKIRIDIPARKLDVVLTDEEVKQRLAAWKKPAPKITKGYLARYARFVSSADEGAIMK